MEIHIWHIWLSAGIVLLIAEVFIPGFLVACLGIGCFATSITASLTDNIKIQLAVFSIVTLAVLFLLRPVVMKYFYSKESRIKSNTDALIGKKGIVTEKINPQLSKGRVKVSGEDWWGFNIDDEIIEKNTRVIVERIEGTKLFVRRDS